MQKMHSHSLPNFSAKFNWNTFSSADTVLIEFVKTNRYVKEQALTENW